MQPDWFWSQVKIGNTNDCWEWQGVTCSDGYGRVKTQPHRNDTAHRVAYILDRGHSPPKAYVCHTCNNKQCVNPKHLYSGTASENMSDASDADVLGVCGEDNPASTLTTNEVKEIRVRYERGMTMTDLATDYEVSRTSISNIVKHKTWQHV